LNRLPQQACLQGCLEMSMNVLPCKTGGARFPVQTEILPVAVGARAN
jgi:hypothetical protein